MSNNVNVHNRVQHMNAIHVPGVAPSQEVKSISYLNITVAWETITQKIAREYLERNTRNRRLNDRVIRRYLLDMQTGNWILTHQGIAFRHDGVLADGQHRLAAVVEFDKPVPMLVTRGLSDEAVMAIDRNRIRSLADSLKILGYEHNDYRTVAVARRVLVGTKTPSTSVLSDSDLRVFLEAHIEAILFASTHTTREYGPASIRGLIARAYYHVDPETLEAFGTILSTGDGDRPGSGSVRRLREFMIGSKVTGTAGSRFADVLYRRAQNALRFLREGKDVRNLHEYDQDLFPLPAHLTIEALTRTRSDS